MKNPLISGQMFLYATVQFTLNALSLVFLSLRSNLLSSESSRWALQSSQIISVLCSNCTGYEAELCSKNRRVTQVRLKELQCFEAPYCTRLLADVQAEKALIRFHESAH